MKDAYMHERSQEAKVPADTDARAALNASVFGTETLATKPTNRVVQMSPARHRTKKSERENAPRGEPSELGNISGAEPSRQNFGQDHHLDHRDVLGKVLEFEDNDTQQLETKTSEPNCLPAKAQQVAGTVSKEDTVDIPVALPAITTTTPNDAAVESKSKCRDPVMPVAQPAEHY